MKIIVSGSSSGIGRAITQTLLDLGYFVIGLARDHSNSNLIIANIFHIQWILFRFIKPKKF